MRPKYFVYFLTYISLILPVNSQLDEFQRNKIDDLFKEWNKENHPGGVIGIMQKGEIIYSKAFGLASLEYQVSNKTETIFNIASVSKQFTAMGIVLLEEKGLLSFDDDIRKYLPNMPDFGNIVTIRHMLHHTSGMRSLHAMLTLAGWRNGDRRTDEDLYRFMLHQKELNFVPGNEFLYCNSGYILMAKIIENITKEKFSEWMKTNVFVPLGMLKTYVEDRHNRVVLNNATSYYGKKDNFYRAVEFWDYVGSGNMHSTINDLLIWLQNFNNSNSKWSSSFKKLITIDSLNNGSKNNYAFGVFLDEVKGYKRISHGGGIGGFRSFVSTYPDEELSVVLLTNFSTSTSAIERKIINLLLKEKSNRTKEVLKEEIQNTTDKYSLAQLTGRYKIKEGLIATISIKNDSLHVLQEWNKSEYNIYNTKGNIYKNLNNSNLSFIFSEFKNNVTQVLTVYNKGNKSIAIRYSEKDLSDVNLNNYLGKFYSEELESYIKILNKDDKLFMYHGRHGEISMKILEKDIFKVVNFATINFVRTNNIITGLRISNGRAKNVWFEKF